MGVSIAGHALVGLVRFYRYTLSSVMGRQCRYLPTCSEYAEDAVRRHGAWAGGWIGVARIARCNPLGAAGFDPVPDALPGNARWYKPWHYGCWSGRHITLRPDSD